jgi:hypothetical protein
MFFKKLASVASIALLITLAGCGGPSGTFTGTEDVAKPVYVVKIDDTREAHPQIGINQADLVFIEVSCGIFKNVATRDWPSSKRSNLRY